MLSYLLSPSLNTFVEIKKNLDYPETARKAGTQGRVLVAVQISETGKVLQTKIKESVDPKCDKAAMKAIYSVEWEPAKQDNNPVAVWIAVPVDFKLK